MLREAGLVIDGMGSWVSSLLGHMSETEGPEYDLCLQLCLRIGTGIGSYLERWAGWNIRTSCHDIHFPTLAHYQQQKFANKATNSLKHTKRYLQHFATFMLSTSHFFSYNSYFHHDSPRCRLQQMLAIQKRLRIFQSTYRVLWCSSGADEILENSQD